LTPHNPDVVQRQFSRTFNGPGPWREYDVASNGKAQNLIRGKDISERVAREADRMKPDVPSTQGGFSGEVSRGERPKHRAGSWESMGIGPLPVAKKKR
jgi:hypothetical protein